MKVTYDNAAKEITLEQAINAYKYGIATIITDGRDVAFEIENDTGLNSKSKKCTLININTKEIKEFPSMRQLGIYLGKSSGWVYSVVKEKGSKFNYKNYQIKVGDAKCLE